MIESLKEMFEESATKQSKKDFGKVVVLDYSTSGVYIYDYDGSNILDFLDNHGHNDSECSYMFTSDFNIYIE